MDFLNKPSDFKKPTNQKPKTNGTTTSVTTETDTSKVGTKSRGSDKSLRRLGSHFLILLVLILTIASGYMYWQNLQALSTLQEQESRLISLSNTVNDIKRENTQLKATYAVQADAAEGAYFKALATAYGNMLGSSSGDVAAEASKIEAAYKQHHKLPETAQPLKEKKIEVVSVYKEDGKDRALVFLSSSNSNGKPAGFMPFVKEGQAWKYAEPRIDL